MAAAAVASWEEQLPHQLSAMLDDLPVVELWPRFLVIDFFARLVPRADAGPIHAQRMRYARSRPEWWAAQACAEALLQVVRAVDFANTYHHAHWGASSRTITELQ